ncbi:hypothetical protein GTW44_31245 [Streptomyces sp. SID8360]|nr:hypothetical protein SACTE_4867 [Streptomyces sp. SirexAA-E]MYR67355.1 hypothetical protein [Streptomyces sp. SID4939]MYT62772.1 hypothetical protein [Streptomyces sp. SID8357]MYT89132.1 hypothetical protein [Streptomyces sp. SID8360]MYW40146.1 hypothetical protein [Streptomyces sp. SID1]PZX32825.1 hypothetical protein K373_05569 [Streptomyces sp. DvalAA-21]RAJ28977.1 hypothetical protein K351_05396 [Streptomyces sp. DpondAA-E10]RAJ42888.1 hypothetical protein K352_05387 [Streptomyces sp.
MFGVSGGGDRRGARAPAAACAAVTPAGVSGCGGDGGTEGGDGRAATSPGPATPAFRGEIPDTQDVRGIPRDATTARWGEIRAART